MTAAQAQVVNDGTTNTLNNVTNQVTGELAVGTNGSFTSLLLTNSALLSNSGNAFIGRNTGANSNRVWLSGANTRWITRDLYVGSNGAFNSLVISNGAQVVSRAGNIGFSASSSNNTVIVTGAGSLWTNSVLIAPLLVGGSGGGNRLVISAGGRVDDGDGIIGNASSNNEALVTGSNSFWNHAFQVYVGFGGTNNRLVISNGGLVGSTTGSIGQGSSGSNNTAVVTGPGSYWSNRAALYVGRNAGGNRLVVEDGGRVDNTRAIIGDSGSGGNEALVTGGGSLWSNRMDLVVGLNTSGNRLVVSNGGTVLVASNGLIGANSGANSNIALVTGAGSRWLIPNDLFIGSNGAFNRLVVSNGAVVQSSRAFFGLDPSAGNNEALVTGAGAVWSNGFLTIGTSNSGNRLTIAEGGRVRTGPTTLGLSASSTGNQVLVTGAGSVWSNSSDLYLGFQGSGNRLVVSNGGRVRNTDGYVGYLGSSSDNEVVVTGAGSVWANSDELIFGQLANRNRLVVSEGGAVTTGRYFYLDYGASSGNEVVVTGADSLLSSDVVYLGWGEGNGNRITVSNGGTVFARNGVYVGLGASSSGSRLVVEGGTLRASNGDRTAFLDIRRGTNVLNAGLVDVQQLVVTSAVGFVEHNGGTLRAQAAHYNNGRLYTVGNGVSPARYELAGGTHSFNNSLVISSNATLGGSGLISTGAASLTNRGTINPGTAEAAGGLYFVNTLTLLASAQMSFDLGGLIPGETYDQVTGFTVQYAGTLSLGLLNGFLPEPEDSFTLLSFITASGAFLNAPNGSRLSLSNNLASFAVTQTANAIIVGDVQYVDSDGDGHPDLFEQAAGTDPQDPRSALQILSVTLNTSGHAVVRFPFIFTQRYRVEYSDDLVTWTPILNPVLGNPLPFVAEWIDNGSLTGGLPNGRYYRVGLQ